MTDGFDNSFNSIQFNSCSDKIKTSSDEKYHAQGAIATKTKTKPVTVTNSESISRNEFFHEFRIQCISRSLEFFSIRLLRQNLALFRILFHLNVTLASRTLWNSFSFDCYPRISHTLEFFFIRLLPQNLAHFRILFHLIVMLTSRTLKNSFSFECYTSISHTLEFFFI